MKKVSAIIINYNTSEMTEKVIRRLKQSKPNIDWELILVDNNSQEKILVDRFEKIGCQIIKNKKNLGFARAVNQGLDVASGDYILLLNSDVLVETATVDRLLQCLTTDQRTMIVGPQMIYPDGRFQASFGIFPSLKSELWRFSLLYKIFSRGTFSVNSLFKKINLQKIQKVDWVSGGCLLFEKKLLNKIGKLDEHYFLGGEDIDFCYQAQQSGYLTKYCPQAKVIHYHGYSSGKGGARSRFRVSCDRDGLVYFFQKNFPNKKFTRQFIKFLHNLKLKFIK